VSWEFDGFITKFGHLKFAITYLFSKNSWIVIVIAFEIGLSNSLAVILILEQELIKKNLDNQVGLYTAHTVQFI